jgi:hypothetical protein
VERPSAEQKGEIPPTPGSGAAFQRIDEVLRPSLEIRPERSRTRDPVERERASIGIRGKSANAPPSLAPSHKYNAGRTQHGLDG